MIVFRGIGRVLLGLVIVIGYYSAEAKSDGEIVALTNNVLKEGMKLLTNIDLLITPLKFFAKISGFMSVLGPVGMAASAILTVVTLFLPKEDSPELKAIKAGFEKVNNRLDIVTAQIGALDNIAELSNAKSAFVDSLTVINSNYEALVNARKKDKPENYQFFAKQYQNTFSLATDKIYDSLVGSHGSLGFDIVNLYKIHVKCNPQLLADFCTKGMQLIIQGLEIEGAYMGVKNFTEQAKSKGEAWKPKMDALTKHCSVRIEECENNWKTYAYQQFQETFRQIGGDKQAFAQRLATEMNNIAPQRSWLAVAYGDAWGFGPHTFSAVTTYEIEKMWHQNDHCATIVSIERSAPLTGGDYDNFKKVIDDQKVIVEAVNDCKTTINWLIPADRYDGNDARFIVEKIREKYGNGFVNAVRVDYNPGVASTGNTLYVTTVKWQCTSSPFKLIIFQ